MVDFMQYLQDAYIKSKEEEIKNTRKMARKVRASAEIQQFVDFCRKLLVSTPPVSVFTAIRGLGLKMADGTEVPILEQFPEDKPVSDVMPITRPVYTPGFSGISGMTSKQVFGK